ncbi:MAG: glutathione synthase [Sandaracinaceae bacterium]
MRILVVMDPPSTVLVDEDTSFGIMLAAQTRGHRVDHCLITDLYLEGDRAGARVRRATCSREAPAPLTLGEAEDASFDDIDVVFMRKDPPFDEDYLFASLVLEHARASTLLVNDPRGLRDANEKLYAMQFAKWMPETLVSNDKARILAFIERMGGHGVIKPLSGAGGDGVFKLSLDDPNKNGIIETVTRGGTKLAMAQQFLPEVTEGDKRILLLDGELLGAINRIPTGGDLRSNIHVGGRVAGATLTDADRAIIEAVAPQLRKDGLFFVGLDVIGGRLTEVNVTSPTGIQQASRLSGEDLEGRVIDWLEDRVAG